MIEYASAQANNSSLPWWQTSGSGVRIYHINATLQRDYWYTYLKYQNGTEYNNDGVGIRAIRIVNDTTAYPALAGMTVPRTSPSIRGLPSQWAPWKTMHTPSPLQNKQKIPRHTVPSVHRGITLS